MPSLHVDNRIVCLKVARFERMCTFLSITRPTVAISPASVRDVLTFQFPAEEQEDF